MMEPDSKSPAGSPAPPSNTSEPVELASVPLSLHRSVHARRAEYTRPYQIRVKVGTWNVAACPGTDQDLASWFVSGKGIDRRLTSVSAAASAAIEPEASNDSLEEAPADGVRLVGGDKISLYALGLQEIVDLGGASQYMSRATAVLEKWKAAMETALPAGYELVVSEQMAGMLLMVYASPEVAPMVSHVSTSVVGTGLLGMLGNKGAVSAKIVLGEATSIVFVNSHLSSGHEPYYLERRCWDVAQIESRSQFAPFNHPGVVPTVEPDKLGDEDVAFWFGDLNFRLADLPGDDIRRILTLHTRGEYGPGDLKPGASGSDDPLDGEDAVVLKDHEFSDTQSTKEESAGSVSPKFSSLSDTEVGSILGPDEIKVLYPLPDADEFSLDAADDPASLQATLDCLLPHDQLKKVIRERKAFHDGWREGRITFLPSYKYDVGSVGLFDSSEKRRPPSWCDRILYRSRKNKEDYEQRIKDEEEARKKDEEMKARGLDLAGDEDEVLFDVQADSDDEGRPSSSGGPSTTVFAYDEYDENEDNEAELENVDEPEDGTDRIHLDIYASHQRITSSDHKPVVCVFTVDCDAVVPELKAKVLAEVAKELDRAENEGRPAITIVTDRRASSNVVRRSDADDVIDFGAIEFMRRVTASLTIANTGRVPAEFSFVEKPSTDDLRDSGSLGALPYQWLTSSFVQHDGAVEGANETNLGKDVILEPGETVNMRFEVFVGDVAFARMLNDGAGILEDVLVLRVYDGRDYFLPVRAVWSPTCIGRSVEELIRVPDGGIRQFVASLAPEKNGSKTVAAGSIPYDLDVHFSAPKELFKLTEQIENLTDRVIADEQMLAECKIPTDKPGWPFEELSHTPNPDQVAAIIRALDNDCPVLDAFAPEVSSLVRLEVVSYVLLLFLQGLTDGIVTIPLWTRIDQAPLTSLSGSRVSSPGGRDPNSENDKTVVLDILASAPYHNISFVFLTTALSRVLGELSPLSLSDLDTLRSISRNPAGSFGAFGNIGNIGRRSLSSFRKGGTASVGAALDALERRQVRERRVAAIFGKIICRAPTPTRERDRRSLEDKQKAVIELFLRRSREELS